MEREREREREREIKKKTFYTTTKNRNEKLEKKKRRQILILFLKFETSLRNADPTHGQKMRTVKKQATHRLQLQSLKCKNS